MNKLVDKIRPQPVRFCWAEYGAAFLEYRK